VRPIHSAKIWSSQLGLMIGFPAAALVVLLCPAAARAQNSASSAAPGTNGVSASLPAVTAIPIPLQSTSGRFSSLNPPNQLRCPSYSKVIGRVVSTRLIVVQAMDCQGRGQTQNVMVNVKLANPADTVQMVAGRRVAITATFRSAWEHRTSAFTADYLIAENAELVAGDPIDRSAPAFTSYMLCQPPELDTLAKQLGHELCVQSTLVANLAAAGPALETAAGAPENVSPEDTVSGDPNAITCRPDTGTSDRHLSAIACARNSYWLWYKAKWRAPLSPIPAPP
jgi:hypothetical protein